jgi:hypothetical protein
MNNNTKATIPIKIFTTIFRLIECQRCQNLHLKPLQNSGKNLQHSHISIAWSVEHGAFGFLPFEMLRSSDFLAPCPLLPAPCSMLPSIRFPSTASRLRRERSTELTPKSQSNAQETRYSGSEALASRLLAPCPLLPAPCSLPLAPCPLPLPPKCVNHVTLSKSSVTALLQIQYNLVLIKLIINF